MKGFELPQVHAAQFSINSIIWTKGQLILECLFDILLLWQLKSNCFSSFFGRFEDTQKKTKFWN